MKRIELLPCPFCGSTNVGEWKDGSCVYCNACGCEGPVFDKHGDDSLDYRTEWNRRAPAKVGPLRTMSEVVLGCALGVLLSVVWITAILAVLGFLSPANAAPSYNWGGSSATLVMGPGVPVATVICHNEVTTAATGRDEDFTLSVGAFEVQVSVWQEWGDVPDRYTVTPPDGYVAVPQFIDVDENGTAEIQIYSMEGFGA